jgi:uncharacterized protein YkwD
MRRAPRALASLCVAFALGCGAATGPSVRPPTVRFAAPGAPSAVYRSDAPEGVAVSGPHAETVREAVARAGPGRHGALVPDPRLATLARWALDHHDDHAETVPHAVLDLWAHHLGLFEPAPHVLVLGGGGTDGLGERVTVELRTLLAQHAYTHWGGASLARGDTHAVVLVLSWRWATIEPVPRVIAPGDTLRVRGTLLPGYEAPELIVTRDHPIERGALPVRGEGAARFAFEATPRERDSYRVELLARGPLGATVVANFPVDVGVASRTAVEVAARGAAVGESAAVERLLDLVNASRERAGLAPLVPHDGLAEVARAHGEDMRANGFVGHTSPTTGGAPERVARAGIRTHAVLENIGQGYSPEEVHEGLMQSPGHRANILHRDATHVGIGVVTREDGSSTLYLVTELFMRVSPRIDVDDAPDSLFDRIGQARAKRRLSTLARDDALFVVCADAARAFFASKASSEEVSQRVATAARARRLPYRRMRAIVLVTDAIDGAAELDVFLDREASAVGLGVAQGTRADTNPDAIVVVAILAYAE